MTQTTDLQAIADALRRHDRFLVVTHENPDGDALGSLLAATLALRRLGKDAVMYLAGTTPLPREYAFMPLGGLLRQPPRDAAERVLVALDCAKQERIGDEAVLAQAPLVLDIDHHHDNTRFGDLNLIVADASSTGEVLRDVIAELGLELTPELAEPLYIALVTDTGRFQYANTTPKALRLEGGRIVVSYLLRSDFAEVGAAEPYSEGIIDYLRAVEGAELAVLIREQLSEGAPAHKGSLRSSIDELDVSAIARRFGGGGHRQAAGFASDLPLAEIVELVREGFLAQRAAART